MEVNNGLANGMRSPPTAWHIHQKTPSKMYIFFILYVLLVLGHHFLYATLDGQLAIHQDWMIRSGTALATVLLSSAIGVALAQRIWSTLRMQFLSLGSIDALATITSDPQNFFNAELLLTALVPIFTPGSLTVIWKPSVSTDASTIRNLNFSINALEHYNDASFGETAKLFDWYYFSVNPARAGGSPCYGKASSLTSAVVYQTAYGGHILQGDSPCGANCTFLQAFMGPSYKCTPVAPRYDGALPYFRARNSTVDFCEKYPANYSEGECVWNGPEDEFQDGIIDIDYIFVPAEYRGNISSQSEVTNYVKYAFTCEQWRTAFTIRRTYTDYVQTMAYNFTYLSRIPYWPVSHFGEPAENEAISSTYSYPSFYPGAYFGNFTIPISDEVGYAIHDVLYGLLRGVIGLTPYGEPTSSTRIGGTKLVESTVWPSQDGIQKPKEDFGPLLEELSRNVTLSLFSVDNLVYLEPENQIYVTTSYYNLVFSYSRLGLWLPYGIALVAGAVAVLVGNVSLYANGVAMNTGILTFIATTRGRRMDQIASGACLGAQPMPKELEETKVKFGEIAPMDHLGWQSSQMRHAGFGIEGEVWGLVRGQNYG